MPQQFRLLRYFFESRAFLLKRYIANATRFTGLDALSKHAGGMFVAKERSNL